MKSVNGGVVMGRYGGETLMEEDFISDDLLFGDLCMIFLFLVGVFEEKARLSQWLTFLSVQRDRSTFFIHLVNYLAERLTGFSGI